MYKFELLKLDHIKIFDLRRISFSGFFHIKSPSFIEVIYFASDLFNTCIQQRILFVDSKINKIALSVLKS